MKLWSRRSHRSTLPGPAFCKCGHRVKWYTIDPDPDTASVFYRIAEDAGVPHIKMHEDVVERDCPHRNGTVTQHCPTCDSKVGMWGCGSVGGMECDCWDTEYVCPHCEQSVATDPNRIVDVIRKWAWRASHRLNCKGPR